MKKKLILAFILLGSISIYAQDVIVKKNGEKIQAKVQEVTVNEIKYKKYTNLTGPMYSILKSDIAVINYEDGSKDIFEKTSPTPTASSNTQNPAITQTREDDIYRNENVNATARVSKEKKDSNVKFGLETGFNVSNVNSENYKPGASMEDWAVYPRFGFNIGMLLDFKLSKFISIQPEFKISLKGCKREGYMDIVRADNEDIVLYHDAFNEWHINFTYLEVPVNLVFNISTGNGNLFIGGGPYLAYGVYGKNKNSFSYEGKNINDEMIESSLESNLFSGENKMYRPFDWGSNLLTGYEFSNGFFIKAGYSFSMASISTNDFEKVNVKNNCLDVSVGFKF